MSSKNRVDRQSRDRAECHLEKDSLCLPCSGILHMWRHDFGRFLVLEIRDEGISRASNTPLDLLPHELLKLHQNTDVY